MSILLYRLQSRHREESRHDDDDEDEHLIEQEHRPLLEPVRGEIYEQRFWLYAVHICYYDALEMKPKYEDIHTISMSSVVLIQMILTQYMLL